MAYPSLTYHPKLVRMPCEPCPQRIRAFVSRLRERHSGNPGVGNPKEVTIPEVIPQWQQDLLRNAGDRSRLPNEVEQVRSEFGSLRQYLADDYEFREWLGLHERFWNISTYRAAKAGKTIPIYRAVPEEINEIHPGAYVTQSKEYAQLHLESVLGGKGHILEGKATIDELAAVNPNEFWYIPEVKPSPAIPKAPVTPDPPEIPPPPWGAKWALTPATAHALARIAAEAEWPPLEPLPPEYELPLIACDLAFLGKDLKNLCEERGLSTSGHKKILGARLLSLRVEEVVDATEAMIPEAEALLQKKGKTVEV